MSGSGTTFTWRQTPVLLRGETEFIRGWIGRTDARQILVHVLLIVAGTGLYGAAMGCWRSGQQAAFAAIKFPLVALLTTLGNALLNGMLAQLLGVNLRFRESLLTILMSFTIAALVMAAGSPLILFLVWNAPPMSTAAAGSTAYEGIKLAQVAVIAFAGVAANVRLWQLLREVAGGPRAARKVLIAWLAGNLFLGSQLCWNLRPLIGSPHLPVEFLRPNAFEGNFYETVWNALRHFLFS